MKGIFLHVLGDAVGSVVVILSAGLMYFYNNCSDDLNGKCVIHPSAMECGDFLVNDNGLNETDLKMYLNQSRKSLNFSVYYCSFAGVLFMINSDMEEQTINLMFPNKATHWTLYVDPATSLILTALILYTTLGLLRGKYPYQIFRLSQTICA